MSSSSTTYTIDVDGTNTKHEELGQFRFRQYFKMNKKVDGYIVQKITRTLVKGAKFDMRDIDNTMAKQTASDFESYTTSTNAGLKLSTWNTYWELFEVVDGVSVSADAFSLTGINPDENSDTLTSAGIFTMTGEAFFVGKKPSGFSQSKADEPPAGLDATLKDPGLTPESGTLTRTVTIEWFGQVYSKLTTPKKTEVKDKTNNGSSLMQKVP